MVNYSSMARPRILLIQDDPALRSLFRFNLEEKGFVVLDAVGGSDVLALIKKESPDLIVLDLMVQNVDGFELCRRICKSRKNFVMAYDICGDEKGLVRNFELGVEDYLGKPFGVDELTARIKAILRPQNVHRSLYNAKSKVGRRRSRNLVAASSGTGR